MINSWSDRHRPRMVSAVLQADREYTGWFELGSQLFKDRDDSRIQFITGDLLQTTAEESLAMLPSSVSSRIRVISAFAFFHLYSQEQQLHLAKTVWSMLEKEAGNIIFGIQKGMSQSTLRNVPQEKQGQDVFFW
jgi:hypothetical protein